MKHFLSGFVIGTAIAITFWSPIVFLQQTIAEPPKTIRCSRGEFIC